MILIPVKKKNKEPIPFPNSQSSRFVTRNTETLSTTSPTLNDPVKKVVDNLHVIILIPISLCAIGLYLTWAKLQ